MDAIAFSLRYFPWDQFNLPTILESPLEVKETLMSLLLTSHIVESSLIIFYTLTPRFIFSNLASGERLEV